MRRNILIVLVLSIALVGCNLPMQPTSVSPTQDTLATQVALRLTFDAQTLVPTVNGATPAPTQPTAATQTPAPQTATSTATLENTVTPEASPSPSPSPSPSTSATASLTPTPTGIPGDPASDLGAPTWTDTFQKPSTWGLSSPYDDGHTRVSIQNGKLVLESYDAKGWHGWRMLNTNLKNFYLEATIQTLNCSGADLYGLVFRSPDNFKGFWYGVTCDGLYSLEAGDINTSTSLIDAKKSNEIKAGSNQTNRIGVKMEGNQISLYINGKLADETTSDAFPDGGAFGFFIAGYNTTNFTIEVTSVAYWILP